MASRLPKLPGSTLSSPPGTSVESGEPSTATHVSRYSSDYLNASPSFRFAEAPDFELSEIQPEHTCLLGAVADPLLWISQHLRERVQAIQTIATELSLRDRRWIVSTEQREIISKNVILAVGSVPKKLAYERIGRDSGRSSSRSPDAGAATAGGGDRCRLRFVALSDDRLTQPIG